MRTFFLFFLLSFAAGSASAASFGWYWESPSKTFGSWAAARDNWKSQANLNEYNGDVLCRKVQDTLYQCYQQYSQSTSVYIWRTGDSCPDGAAYNSDTGSCDGPPKNPCEDAKGASKTAYWTASYPGGNPPSSTCLSGCLATYSGVMACGNTIKGLYGCTGKITVTGEQCTASTSAPAASETKDTSKWPTDTYSTEPCTWSVTNMGTSKCTGKYSSSTTGQTKCGSVNGTWTCTESPKSSTTDKVSESSRSTTSNSDGSTTTTTTTTTTSTNCVGVGGSCTSSTSTSTTTGGKNSDGSDKGESSTCTGDKCTKDGKAEEPAAGDDDGKEEEGSEEGEKVDGPKAPAEKGSFDGEGDKWDAKIKEAKEEFKGKLDDLQGLFKGIVSVNIGAGAQLYCPPPVQFYGADIDVCPDRYAEQLSWIGTAFFFSCALVALGIIFL